MARILVADDDPQACEVIARICQFKGHEVLEARDAVHALREFESFRPDVVVTDLAMPLGGGQHLLREMRSTPNGAALPVIVVTGYADLLGPRERELLEPCTILAKPLELHHLLEALDAAVERAQPSDASS